MGCACDRDLGITNQRGLPFVRSPCSAVTQRAIVCTVVIFVTLLGVGCSRFKRQEAGSVAPASIIPLTPALWISPSLTTASIPYLDACGTSTSVPISALLVEAVPKKLGQVLTGVTPQYGDSQTISPDGVIEAGLGVKQIDMTIPGQVKGTYPATVTLGMDLMVLGADGAVLMGERLQGAGRGEVEVADQSCEVKGLEAIVAQAIEQMTDAMARQVSQSGRVREYADLRKTGTPKILGSTAPQTNVVPGGMAATSIPSTTPQVPPAFTGDQASALSFKAILRDENHDQLLDRDEALTIEVEVKNEGKVEAKGVEVVVGGMDEIAMHFPPVVLVGDLYPGEAKLASITKQVSTLKNAVRGDLVLSVRSATPIGSVPPAKKFTLMIKPEKSDDVAAVPDVDELPKSIGSFKNAKAVVIAIGVEEFRDRQMSSARYAAHDAEMVAEYFREIGNVPDDRVRVLRDAYALKQDLIDTFDEWLPQRVDASTTVYVFFAGRAVVDGETGAVSLVPHDGTPAMPKRLFSVRHLQQSLFRKPIHRAILMFDVSLDPSAGAKPATVPAQNWGASGSETKNQVMWMIGNRALQEAFAYEPGKHGLFTYHLLRGLQGLADLDRDGTVLAGELCLYAKGEVARMAKEQFGNDQEPLCVPPPGQEAMIRIHPIARGNNPKPVPTTAKKEEPVPDDTSQVQQPMNVGIGP